MQYEFFDDGTIEVKAASTGRKLGGANDVNGHLQHNFAWRVNLDVAGRERRLCQDLEHQDGRTLRQGQVEGTSCAREASTGTPRASLASRCSMRHAHERARPPDPTGYTLAPIREGVCEDAGGLDEVPALGYGLATVPLASYARVTYPPTSPTTRSCRTGPRAVVHRHAQPRGQHAR